MQVKSFKIVTKIWIQGIFGDIKSFLAVFRLVFSQILTIHEADLKKGNLFSLSVTFVPFHATTGVTVHYTEQHWQILILFRST